MVETEAALREVVARASTAATLAVDLEASGMFSYRANLCLVQLAWDGELAIIDTLAVPPALLGPLLGEHGPLKIIHDVAFDARLLAEVGLELANVHDTALAARMLGRASTGLASLLESELGLTIAKDLQKHDWRERPLDGRMLAYLSQDVAHLAALNERIWGEVEERGIVQEVLEETRYRLGTAVEAVRHPDTTPAYARVKGVERLAERELAVLRVIAELRETEASRRDVPPHRVASADALLAIAKERPRTAAQVARIRGVPREHPDTAAFADAVVRAVASAGTTLPPEELARFDRPRVPAPVVRARREREARLIAWRRAEAKRRGVDEQVVLPGHCLKDAVDLEAADVSALRAVPGIGAFRVERDGEAMASALRGEGPQETAP